MPALLFYQINKVQDFLKHLYDQPKFLPPLWRIIYQEGMREHHIIFRDSNLIEIAQEKINFPISKKDMAAVGQAVYALFASHSISMMITIVESLTKKQKCVLFHIYRSQLLSWQLRQLQQLN